MQEKKLTGYPSIDKPWLKYYSEEAINAPLPECTIYEYLWENSKDHLNDIALNYYGKKWTYQQLFDCIDHTARSYSAMGVKNDDVVVLLMLNTPESVFSFYALSKLGAVANYINVQSTRMEIDNLISECGCKLVLTQDLFAEKLPVREDVKVIYAGLFNSLRISKRLLYRLKVHRPQQGISWRQFWKKDAAFTQAAYMDSHIGLIGHSGGTTGSPKSILLRDQALNGLVQECKNVIPPKKGERFLCAVIPFVLYGLCVNLHFPLILGNEVILAPKVDNKIISSLLKKYKPNHVCSVPSVWSAFTQSKELAKEDVSYLVSVISGGDAMSPELEKQVNTFIKLHGGTTIVKKGYGMSEVSSVACANTNSAPSRGNDSGIPLSHVLISAFDVDSGKEKLYGEIGEICISSPYAMEGYLNNELETTSLIRMHEDGLNWVHTGDLGYVDSDGFVFITGRIKRIFIVRKDGVSVKVFPDQTEASINKSTYVNTCCVVPVPDDKQVNKVIAWVVKNEDVSDETAQNEILQLCRDLLPSQFVPDEVFFINHLPLTAVGKIDYRALEKRAEEMKDK